MNELEEESQEDENIYDEKDRESKVEDGEISPEEEAFMRGYDEAGHSESEDEDEE